MYFNSSGALRLCIHVPFNRERHEGLPAEVCDRLERVVVAMETTRNEYSVDYGNQLFTEVDYSEALEVLRGYEERSMYFSDEDGAGIGAFSSRVKPILLRGFERVYQSDILQVFLNSDHKDPKFIVVA